MPDSPDTAPPPSARGATRVALGILLSRLAGLIRTRVFAHAFGTSPIAGAFSAALRIPNTLQNLLGEGVLEHTGWTETVYRRLDDPEGSENHALVRVYEAGRPLASPRFFRWSAAGAKEGDLTFVPGQPGASARLRIRQK